MSAKRFLLPVYGPEKILSLATPTLQSQPVRKIICRWCLSLIFHVLHMSVHTQKAHSSSYYTRKSGKCFQMEDFFRSFHQMKQTSLAFGDLSWLLCKPNKFNIKASFGLSGSTVEDCALWLLLWDHMLLEWMLSPWSGRSYGNCKRFPGQTYRSSAKIIPVDRTGPEILH